MVAELEKVNNRYTYKIAKGEKVLLASNYTYSTKSDAIRGFRRFSSAIKRKENIRFCNKDGCFSVAIESNKHVVANILNILDRDLVSNFTNKLSKNRLFINDKTKRKMYYFIENIEKKHLSKPLKVSIEKENDEYISFIENLNIFAYGSNLNEVMDELKYDLNELYTDLFSNKYQLSNTANEFKSILISHF